MHKKYTKPLLLFFLILSSCIFEEPLRNTRRDYIGDNIRIDGFYYSYFQGKIFNVLLLYRNGVFFDVSGDGKDRTKPEEVEELLTEEHIKLVNSKKYDWGIFIVEGNSILFETWRFTQRDHRAVFQSGEILNDTTFHITKHNYSDGGIKDANTLYYFYPYSPKPDSTNTFIN